MKRTVLLVEDEADARDLMKRALVRAGYACVTAGGKGEAIARAREAGFVDAVVTDVVMEDDERAGLTLLSELRAIGVFAPVVMVTAYADIEKVKTALNAGAAHFLEKPFDAKELVAAVEGACNPAGTPAHAVLSVLARAKLTEKERTVALHLLDGKTSAEIALLEKNSEKTIRQHVGQIYAKCGVSSRAELFRLIYVR